jgi:hypothetical protein
MCLIHFNTNLVGGAGTLTSRLDQHSLEAKDAMTREV